MDKDKKKDKDDFDPAKHYRDNIEPYLESKGFKKMWNYFIEISKTDYFKNFIENSRKKYGIPADGFKPKGDHYIGHPLGFELHQKLDREIDKICAKYSLHSFDYSDVIERYVYYNFLEPLGERNANGLFIISDIVEEKVDPYSEEVQKSDDKSYPVAIRISPYASQRDLVDFIKNKTIWRGEIKYLLDKYKVKGVKIGKVKFKKETIQKRNEFIYQNRNLPRKQIMSMVSDKFKESLDYGHIGKIVSLEIKKRKEV